jgi:NADPH:quinone reductase-like Zn-dependent oxidoreductase
MKNDVHPPANEAVWLRRPLGRPELGPAPYTPAAGTDVVIRTRAIAVNPVDVMPGIARRFGFRWLSYPAVLGSDVAGEVVEVGPAVSRFRVGDRVLGHALGIEKSHNRPAEGAFQHYTVLAEHMSTPIPDDLSYERAAVLPLGMSTAASALFDPQLLGLPLPATPAAGRGTVLVWGGSTSVGSNAIQLAVNAGNDVIATASPRNFGYVTKLGARAAFDYRSATVIADILSDLRGRNLAGAVAIGSGSARRCLRIARLADGSRNVACASLDPSSTLARLTARRHGVRSGTIWGDSVAHNGIGRAVYADFLGRALAGGAFTPAPDPLVIGDGLEHLPAAFAAMRQGVSARKIVVTLNGPS